MQPDRKCRLGVGERLPLMCVVLVSFVLTAGCRTVAPPPAPEPAGAGEVPQEVALHAQMQGRLGEPEASVRERAALVLLSLDYEPALEAVLERMRRGEDPAVRISMIRAAAFCVDHRCFDAVLSRAEDPDPEVRQEAAAALARFTLPEETQALTELVASEETTSQQRELLLGALGEGLAIGAVPAMLAGLNSEDERTRVAAWQALRNISRRQLPLDVEQWREWWNTNSHRTREDVLEEHRRSLSRELSAQSRQLDDLQAQHDELIKLVRAARDETPKLLIESLASAHGVVREYGSFRLAALPRERLNGLKISEEELALLRQALEDPSVEVRRNVIAFVVNLQGGVRNELVRRALRDEDPQVLRTAIGVVEATAGEGAISRVAELLAGSDSAEVREAAANALGKVGSASSIPALSAALEDAAENVRWFAVEGLRKLGATQAAPRIAECLQKDPSARVREIAASALGELGQPASVLALRAALDDENERVRQKATAGLLALAKDSYERMDLIVDAFEQRELLAPARQVLERMIERFKDEEETKGRVVEAYRKLADVLKRQTDFAEAIDTYEALDELMGGSAEIKRELVACWLRSGQPEHIVPAAQEWLAVAGAEERAAVIELALDGVEVLLEAGQGGLAGQLLDSVEESAGDAPEEPLAGRIADLRARIVGQN